MKIALVGFIVSFMMLGCVSVQYKIDKGVESNKHVQVIVNDFVDYLRIEYKRGSWIKIEGGEGNQYISKLRATAIRKGLKVCINKCPTYAVSFETLVERIDGNLLEATLTTPKSIYHRIYKLNSKQRIKAFGNKTVYKRQK